MSRSEFTIEPGEFGPRAVLTGHWDATCADRLRELGARELHLNDARGWADRTLEFLSESLTLDGLVVINHSLDDDTPVHRVKTLRALDLNTYCKSPLDAAAFPSLERCSLEWRKGSESLFEAGKLKTLFLNRYPGKSSVVFSSLQELVQLEIANSAIQEVRGLSGLEHLSMLGLYRLRNLKSLEGIEELALSVLRVNTCSQIEDLAPVGKLLQLTKLQIDNNKQIRSLKVLSGLQHLTELLFAESTDIADGRVDVLLDLRSLKKVAFQNRRHYKMTRDEVARALHSRHPE